MKLRWPFMWRSTHEQALVEIEWEVEKVIKRDRENLEAEKRYVDELKRKLDNTEQALHRVARVAAGEHPEYALPVPKFEFRSDLEDNFRMQAKVFTLAARTYGISFAITDYLSPLEWGRERAAMIASRLGQQLGEEAEKYAYKALTEGMPG